MNLVSISIFFLLFHLSTDTVFLAMEAFCLLMSTIIAVFPREINATVLPKSDRKLHLQSAIAEAANIHLERKIKKHFTFS